MRLAVVCCHFNPCGFTAPVANYVRFREAFGPHPLLTHQALFPGQEPIAHDAVQHSATDRNFLWQKEALLNCAIASLPPDYDAVAWIDADLIFERPDWYEETCRVLEQKAVVQMFSQVQYMLPGGIKGRTALGTVAAKERSGWRAPGGAVAARREVLQHGLYDRFVCGGGDSAFLWACHGMGRKAYMKLNNPWALHCKAWCERIYPLVEKNVGYVTGTVRHLWHGRRENRQHHARHEILKRHGYDPEADVRVSENGLLEWASDKPAMHAEVRNFFRGRLEDSE